MKLLVINEVMGSQSRADLLSDAHPEDNALLLSPLLCWLLQTLSVGKSFHLLINAVFILLAVEKSSLAASRRQRRTFLYSSSEAGNFLSTWSTWRAQVHTRQVSGRWGARCRMCGLLYQSPSALPGAGEDPVEQEEMPAGSGDSAAAFLLQRLGSLEQPLPPNGVPGDDPNTAASVETLSFEVTCADS